MHTSVNMHGTKWNLKESKLRLWNMTLQRVGYKKLCRSKHIWEWTYQAKMRLCTKIGIKVRNKKKIPRRYTKKMYTPTVNFKDQLWTLTSRFLNCWSVCQRFWNIFPLRHDGCDGIPNHQPRDCLLNRLFRCRSNKTSKLRVSGLCVGNSSGTGEFTTQMASNAENVSIWWRHPAYKIH